MAMALDNILLRFEIHAGEKIVENDRLSDEYYRNNARIWLL